MEHTTCPQNILDCGIRILGRAVSAGIPYMHDCLEGGITAELSLIKDAKNGEAVVAGGNPSGGNPHPVGESRLRVIPIMLPSGFEPESLP